MSSGCASKFAVLSSCVCICASAPAGTILVTSGKGLCGYSGDGGPASEASLCNPQGIAVDAEGNVFVSDTFNCVVRLITVETGAISTIVGNGTCGFSGDGGPGTAGQLNNPSSLTLSGEGRF